MTDYADIYFVDGRNADHRTGQHSTPGRVTVGAPGHGVRTVYTHPVQQYGQAQMYGPPGYGPQGWAPMSAPGWNQGPFGSVLSRISTGDLIDLIAQVFAALNPLPAQPVATSDATTDVGNMILYQGALASYAKKDEQVRTLGHLVGKLLG
jgi:hypothetical protein